MAETRRSRKDLLKTAAAQEFFWMASKWKNPSSLSRYVVCRNIEDGMGGKIAKTIASFTEAKDAEAFCELKRKNWIRAQSMRKNENDSPKGGTET